MLDCANACPYVNSKNKDTILCDKDVIYDEDLPDVCKLDVYKVQSDKPQPAVMIIHGGGFSAGGKTYRRGHAQFMALNGFTVFCVDYGSCAYVLLFPILSVILSMLLIISTIMPRIIISIPIG